MTQAAANPVWRRLLYTRLRDAVRGRFDGRLDWRQLVATANLPIEMSDMISEVVRRTRLWRWEKVDVARELIVHFQDGLSTGRTPQQLLTSFGDTRVAAQLIRRAKKRGRPVAWHVARWSGWALLATVVAYVFMGFYLLLGRPSVSTDYLQIVNARAFAVPDAERAWPLYRESLLEMGGEFSLDYETKPFVLAGNVRPDDETWADAESFVVKHATAIAKLRAAGQRDSLGLRIAATIQSISPEDRTVLTGQPGIEPRFASGELVEPSDHLLISVLLPHLQLLRGAAAVLATDCRRAVRANDSQAALDDVRAQLGVSRHLQETSFLVSALAASAAQGTAYAAVQEVLSDHPSLWSNDQLRDLAHLIARTDVDWHRALEGERAWFYDIVQRVYTDNGSGDGRITRAGIEIVQSIPQLYSSKNRPNEYRWPDDAALLAVLPAANLLMASRQEMTDLYDRFLEQSARRLDLPYSEWDEPGAEKVLASLESSRLQALRYVLVTLLSPATSVAARAAESRRGERDGVLIGIALELHRREHGNWPASLDELAPRWLPSLPVDRITGGRLQYKIVDDRPLVYSLGIDKDDDGGREPLHNTAGGNPLHSQSRGPVLWNGKPATDPSNDGDWTIWTTEKSKEPADDRN